MVLWRFLAGAGACVILLCFAAESRKSYGSGSMKVANGALAAILFFILVLMIPDDFPFKIPFQKFFKIVVFPLGRRDPVLELQFV